MCIRLCTEAKWLRNEPLPCPEPQSLALLRCYPASVRRITRRRGPRRPATVPRHLHWRCHRTRLECCGRAVHLLVTVGSRRRRARIPRGAVCPPPRSDNVQTAGQAHLCPVATSTATNLPRPRQSRDEPERSWRRQSPIHFQADHQDQGAVAVGRPLPGRCVGKSAAPVTERVALSNSH